MVLSDTQQGSRPRGAVETDHRRERSQPPSTAALLASASAQGSAGPQSRTAFSGKLPALDGQRLEATIVEVTYPPGGVNPAHRHPCPVIGYVLEGALRMQVKGQPERIYKPGETFFEAPSDVHVRSPRTRVRRRRRGSSPTSCATAPRRCRFR